MMVIGIMSRERILSPIFVFLTCSFKVSVSLLNDEWSCLRNRNKTNKRASNQAAQLLLIMTDSICIIPINSTKLPFFDLNKISEKGRNI